MEIIAKTEKGCLIQATENEVKEILNAVSGHKPKNLKIGQKIPAIDYASTITKVKSLSKNYDYGVLLSRVASFVSEVNKLEEAITKAETIEI